MSHVWGDNKVARFLFVLFIYSIFLSFVEYTCYAAAVDEKVYYSVRKNKQLYGSIKKLKKEKALLQVQIESYKKSINQFEHSIVAERGKTEEAYNKLAVASLTIERLEKEYQEKNSSSEKKNIIHTERQVTQNKYKARFYRYAIIEKDDTLGVLIVNAGQEQGLRKDMVVHLVCDNKEVAVSKIIDVRKHIAAVDAHTIHIKSIHGLDCFIEKE